MSNKTKRYLSVAKRMAQQGDHRRPNHGAVLVKGGNIINAAHNKWSYSSFGKRFRERDKGISTLHAELAAVLNLDRTTTQGTDIYVVRVDKAGEFKMSKPCTMCETALKHVGIKRIYYTTNDGTIECYKL
jgi:tRNA(Arg) A34 adenosine deaminase TadA